MAYKAEEIIYKNYTSKAYRLDELWVFSDNKALLEKLADAKELTEDENEDVEYSNVDYYYEFEDSSFVYRNMMNPVYEVDGRYIMDIETNDILDRENTVQVENYMNDIEAFYYTVDIDRDSYEIYTYWDFEPSALFEPIALFENDIEASIVAKSDVYGKIEFIFTHDDKVYQLDTPNTDAYPDFKENNPLSASYEFDYDYFDDEEFVEELIEIDSKYIKYASQDIQDNYAEAKAS